MKIKITRSFQVKLQEQIEYIAKDKPSAAHKFKNDIIDLICKISSMPYKNRKSIFFNREDIRDLTFKGYIIVYKINKAENRIEVFGFTKYQENPFNE
jgi:plasmid stabilization system protein ParE